MEKNLDYVKIIRDLREDADKTQQEIADVLHTSQTMYARYERGANELPLHHLLTLCEYYDVSADYIRARHRCHVPTNYDYFFVEISSKFTYSDDS